MIFKTVDEECEFLEQMRGVYPGDPFNEIGKMIADLRGVPFEEETIIVTFGDENV